MLASPLGLLTYPLYLTHQYWGLWVIDKLSAPTNRWVVLAGACLVAFVLAWLLKKCESRLAPFVRRHVERGLRRAASWMANEAGATQPVKRSASVGSSPAPTAVETR